MSRLIFLIAIVVVIYLLVRSYRKSISQQDKPAAKVVEDMVRCAHCGVHLPKGEGIVVGGDYFCSAEHRDALRK
mgnify:CR=1 FL=1